MENRKENAYKLFNIPNNLIREEVSGMRENATHMVNGQEVFQQEVLHKLAELDAKVTRLLELLEDK